MKLIGRFVSLITVATFAAPHSYGQDQRLAAADVALQSRDYTSAAKLIRQYLAEMPRAPDAPRQALRLAYAIDGAKSPTPEVREAFQAVQDRYPKAAEAAEAQFRLGMLSVREKDDGAARASFQSVIQSAPDSVAASMARFPLANYLVRERRFRDAIASFAQVAADKRVEPAMRDEALLQTGFLDLQTYFAGREGRLDHKTTPESQWALLESARRRLVAVVITLDAEKANLDVHQTAAAYAECGVAEAYLLEGLPAMAAVWYARATSRDSGLVQAPVTAMAWQGLGVARYRCGRFAAAGEAFDRAIERPATGSILYGLLVPDFLTAQAQLWRATVANRLGSQDDALKLARQCLDQLGGVQPSDPDASRIWLASSHYVHEVEEQATYAADLQRRSRESQPRIAESKGSPRLPSRDTLVGTIPPCILGVSFAPSTEGFR